jgi:serine/tyrosine/threonine adenylyltransferase
MSQNLNPTGTVRFPFDNSYARLPDHFYSRTSPTPVRDPALIRVNRELAAHLGLQLDGADDAQLAAIFAGNSVPDGAEPIAMAYAGHQFGGFVPQLGDGRAILLGEVIDADGQRRDIQLKGSGRTPFSRGGDGRAAVGPVLREYVLSEAMAALGIPTTRALAAVTTGEHVLREQLLPGAIFTRVAASHIRVGTFQYFASRGDVEGVRALADYVISRHYPHAAEAERRYSTLLTAVAAAQADLISRWLMVGFIHGVMNTDNMSIAGETIDYGPCAFMDEYNPATVFSSIDQWGRYAYGSQPRIGEWNLARLAECLLPLLADEHGSADAAVEAANAALGEYGERFNAAYDEGLRRKIGLPHGSTEDAALARELLQLMADNAADFTLTFRRLGECVTGVEGAAAASGGEGALRELFIDTAAIDAWLVKWRARLQEATGSAGSEASDAGNGVRAAMQRVNPAFIPRNHRVEAVIRAATDEGDYAPFEELLDVLSRPYDEQPGYAAYAEPPAEHERVLRTFCGT